MKEILASFNLKTCSELKNQTELSLFEKDKEQGNELINQTVNNLSSGLKTHKRVDFWYY